MSDFRLREEISFSDSANSGTIVSLRWPKMTSQVSGNEMNIERIISKHEIYTEMSD